MQYNNKINILVLLAICMSSVAADTGAIEDIKRTVLDRLNGRVCPPFGKKAKFEVETIQTRSLIYGCAYMGNESLPMFHLWLERPEETSLHGNCDNTQNMDHFMFECLSKHDRPTNKDESEMGWQYISLLEHTAESMQNKTKTRSHRCALYDVHDEDDRQLRIIRMVISKPVIGENFNIRQCNGLSDLLAQDELPVIPERYRYWPDGSLYIYLLGRKAKILNDGTKYPELSFTGRPTTTTNRPSTTANMPSTTASMPSTTASLPSTRTTTKRPTTTEKPDHPSWFFFPNYYLYYI